MADKLYLTSAEMLENSNNREGGLYKWARVSGEFRFVRVIFYEQHLMLVEDGETATSAGAITVNSDFWRIMGQGSITLKVGCSAEDEAALEQMLLDAGRKLR